MPSDESFSPRQWIAAEDSVREYLAHPKSEQHGSDERVQEDRPENRACNHFGSAETDCNRGSRQAAACRDEDQKEHQPLCREKKADIENAASDLCPLQPVPGAHKAGKRVTGHAARLCMFNSRQRRSRRDRRSRGTGRAMPALATEIKQLGGSLVV